MRLKRVKTPNVSIICKCKEDVYANLSVRCILSAKHHKKNLLYVAYFEYSEIKDCSPVKNGEYDIPCPASVIIINFA